jgi:hypothetical protein
LRSRAGWLSRLAPSRRYRERFNHASEPTGERARDAREVGQLVDAMQNYARLIHHIENFMFSVRRDHLFAVPRSERRRRSCLSLRYAVDGLLRLDSRSPMAHAAWPHRPGYADLLNNVGLLSYSGIDGYQRFID